MSFAFIDAVINRSSVMGNVANFTERDCLLIYGVSHLTGNLSIYFYLARAGKYGSYERDTITVM